MSWRGVSASEVRLDVADNIEKIPLSRVYQSETIDRRILDVVKGGNYILGPECKAFEKELAAYFGVKHVVLSSSWTAAVHLLHLAQVAAGKLSPGDEILVPSLTAFPSIEPMIHAGARPVFCDIDNTYTIDPEDARRKITSRTRGILPVHLYGRPANIDAMRKLAADNGLWIIEDCAQSHGAKIGEQFVGSIGDVATFSFYPTKNLGAFGDGGMVVAGDLERIGRVRMLREYGWERRYISDVPGINSRLDELQAAILRVRLPYLDAGNRRRAAIAAAYDVGLADTGLKLPTKRPGATHVYHQYVVRHRDRDQLQARLRERGISTNIHYPVPVHRQPAYAGRFEFDPAGLNNTDAAAAQILSLPMYPELSDAMVASVVDALRRLL